VIGSAVSASATLTDLGGPGAAPYSKMNDFEERGIYVHMLSTGWLSSFGFEANLVAGQTLTARVYAATGSTRGAQIAIGTYTVASSGLQWHDVPVSCQLVEGRDYDIAITYGDNNAFPWWDETTFTEPYAVGALQVVTSEVAGAGANIVLPHYRARWEDKLGGGVFHLAKLGFPDPPPLSMSSSYEELGAFVTMLAQENVDGIGWRADVPAGQPIIARIYEASGNTRTSVPIAEATITSAAAGMRWHDIPLAATLQSGADYDIAIEYQLVNQVRYWGDLMGLPYTSYGVVQVRDAESIGNAAGSALIDLRLHMCNETLTPVTERPARTPMFMAAPAPNPVSDVSRVDFSLDDAGPVSIRVYDVTGRLVNTVLESSRPQGWSHTDLAATNLPSGVYFLKMETRAGSLTRKFVVTH
ncbi:MAG TPA: T9SS type A sorting domain-containing protein, partial [Candidatus Krumholzibacteria bacterium]|nr:T9SS type A sorting domain-containing protein [Candidatus Krumholzibacteria bacterium]